MQIIEAQYLAIGMEISINGFITIIDDVEVSEHVTIVDIEGRRFRVIPQRWIKVWS